MLRLISLKLGSTGVNTRQPGLRLLHFALALALLELSGCVSGGALLNSERITKQFGSYGVDVLRTDEHRRVSSLYSLTDQIRTTRTYAVVDFAADRHEKLQREHAAINAGGSIGATFRNADWQVDKQHIYIGELEVPTEYAEISRLMRIQLPEPLAVHVYLLIVSDDEGRYRYATITEVHHPDYLTADGLRKIYGEIIFDDSNRDRLHDFIGPPNAANDI